MISSFGVGVKKVVDLDLRDVMISDISFRGISRFACGKSA